MVPIQWFEGLKPGNTGIEFQLVAVDRSGNKSAPVKAHLDGEAVRDALTVARKNKETIDFLSDSPVDAVVAQDVRRFQKVAGTPDARAALELLQPLPQSGASLPEPVEQRDAAFKRSLLSVGGLVPLRATLKGQVPVSFSLFMEVRKGRVFPQFSASQLRSLLRALPFEEPLVEDIDIIQYDRSKRSALIKINLNKESNDPSFIWTPGKKIELRRDVKGVVEPRRLLEEQPLYQALVARRGEPRSITTYPEKPGDELGTTEPGSMRIEFDDSLQITYEIKNAQLDLVAFRGSLPLLLVAELEKPLQDIIRILQLSPDESAQAIIEVGEGKWSDNQFMGSVTGLPARVANPKTFVRRFMFPANGEAHEYQP